MEKKIGVFLNDEIMIEYPFEPESFIEAANDCLYAIGETGLFHELKIFEE
jgi:hypothetical protein